MPRIKKRNIFSRFSGWFKNLTKIKKVALILTAVLLVTGTSAGAFVFSRLSNMDRVFDVGWNPNDSDGFDIDMDELFDNRTLNILLMGFDRDENRDDLYAVFRPDTLMLAAINIETGKVNMLSIPRDTLVPIANRNGGIDKINHAYYYGWRTGSTPEERHEAGIKNQIETVRIALRGIPIHHYVSLDMEAVVEIVDIMGGVWFDVPEDTYHNWGSLIAAEGYQHFDGRKFLRYVRSREFADGDKQRARNQQAILVAAFEQFAKANKLVRAPQVLVSMNNNIETDLTLEQIAALALFGTQKVNPNEISNHVLQGRFAMGRTWEGQQNSNVYYIIDEQARAELIKDIWGVNVQPQPTLELLPPRSPDEEVDEEAPPEVPSDVDEPGGQKPGDEKPGDEKPGDEKPGDEKPGDEKPGDEKPGDEKPGDEKPGDEKPGDEKPGDEKPGDEKPGDEKPGDEKPGDEKPGDENGGNGGNTNGTENDEEDETGSSGSNGN